jgi:hypothetical protein
LIKPNFFIVGAPKCGTTALDSYLKQHPEVFIPERKEAHYLCTDFKAPLYIDNLNMYLELFSDAKGFKVVGESSVYYLSSKDAAENIKSFSPDAKIIIMLRNPVDMMYSNHSQLLYSGFETIKDFGQALAAESDRAVGKNLPRTLRVSENHLFYKEAVKYTNQVKRYFDVFGRENVHVILFDDFKSQTEKVYTETLEFLKVESEFTMKHEAVNSNASTRSQILRKFLVYPSARLVGLVRLLLPSRRIRAGIISMLNNFNTDTSKRVRMSPDLEVELYKEFSEEVGRLSVLLNRDLSAWARKY